MSGDLDGHNHIVLLANGLNNVRSRVKVQNTHGKIHVLDLVKGVAHNRILGCKGLGVLEGVGWTYSR